MKNTRPMGVVGVVAAGNMYFMFPAATDPIYTPRSLYDITRDPLEQHNQDKPKYSDVAHKLSKQLHDWQEQGDDPLLNGTLVAPDIA